MLGDTIFALASAQGGSERAVLRISGPAARAVAATVFTPALPAQRAQVDGFVDVDEVRLPALALVMTAPRSFTGEDVVELHVPGSPLLVELLLDAMLARGAEHGVRRALPGEFTARAVQHGRLDGVAVEGLLLLLHAADRRQVAAGVQWLRGGFAAAVHELRAALQDTLAMIEVGLDFDDGETGAVPRSAWLPRLLQGRDELDGFLAAVPRVAPGGEVLLLGRANAGKSSLANALAGRDLALVDATPGTTRDLLRIDVAPGVVLWDAPGDLDAPSAVDAAALALRDRLAGRAAAALLVLDAGAPVVPAGALAMPLPWCGIVWTKCDTVATIPPLPAEAAARQSSASPVFTTSARSGDGLTALRGWLAQVGSGAVVDAGAELRSAFTRAHAAVARAITLAEQGDSGPELIAVELQAALAALDGLAGGHSPEALLDRIYGRFCLGK